MDSVIGIVVTLIFGLAGWGMLQGRKAKREQERASVERSRRKGAEAAQRRATRDADEGRKLHFETTRIAQSTRVRLDDLRARGITDDQTQELDRQLTAHEKTLRGLGL